MATSPDPLHREAARALLDGIRLRDAEIDRHFDCALSPEYWRALVPDLTVGGRPAAPPLGLHDISDAGRGAIVERFQEEGILKTPEVVPSGLTTRMRNAVVTLGRADWPPVFAWIFDEFWQVPRCAPVTGLLESILGAGFVQTPHIWTHCVGGRRGASGWRPHVDYDGDGTRLTLWIALSDATVESGCMCVIPRHLVPPSLDGRWQDVEAIDRKDVMDLLHASRALPVGAGGILGWDAGLMHWGAPRQTAGDARISYSMEFAPATDRHPSSTPWTADLPSHEARLSRIAQAVAMYQANEPRAVRYAGLTARLLERLPHA